MQIVRKAQVTIIGKEGSTRDGEGFIQRLWDDANSHFSEIAHLVRRDEQGALMGVWGAMSDFSCSLQPWEEGFTQGLYLAGVECVDNAEAPEGWTKWILPAYEYVQVDNTAGDAFLRGLQYLREEGLTLAGAVHDFTDPKTGSGFMLFPIKRL